MRAASDHDRQPRICLIVCYFGRLPPYIDLVFKSCAWNPDINWIIITDDQTAYTVPSNVQIVHFTLEGLRDRFSSRLGFPVNLTPLRCCDFRPAFGHLFDDFLSPFDFWGHCDLDMIFGRLRSFLPPDVLNQYDRVMTRGHLCLYKNNPKVNLYFKLSAPGVLDYREIFTNSLSNQFDEWRGIYRLLRYHDIPQYHRECIVDVRTPTLWRNTRFEGYHIENHPLQLFYWYKGRVFQAYPHREGATMDCEYAYIHFQKRRLPAPSFDSESENGFIIGPKGFFPYSRHELSASDYLTFNETSYYTASKIIADYKAKFRRRLSTLRRKLGDQ